MIEEDRDLTLKAIKDGVGRLLADETNHRPAILCIFLGRELDYASCITPKEVELEKKRRRADDMCRNAGVKENAGKD